MFPAFCPPPEWVISLIANMFNFDALFLIIGTLVVMALIAIRIIVWIRDWRASKKVL